MADNNHKVTIDADYFAELYRNENQSHNCDNCKEVHARTKERDDARRAYDELERDLLVTQKERDELKEKLDGECKTCVSQEEAKVLAESLAVAERCIEDIDIYLRDGDYTKEETLIRIRDVVCAYRKAKEGK